MAKISHFLVIVVDLSSETSHSTFNSTGNGHALHYRSKIDDYDAKISHYYHLSIGGCDGPVPVFSAESGAVWRDVGLPKRSEARREANES